MGRKVDPFDEDPFDTPRPGRPTHPDFRVLSRAAIANDAKTDVCGMSFEQAVSEVIDMDSLHYLVRNRVGLMMSQMAIQPSQPMTLLVQAAYFDAFLMGYQYAKERGH